MLTTLVLAGALLAKPQTADKWDIKAYLAPKASTSWDVSSEVMMQGSPHSATLKLTIELKDTAKDKPLKSAYSWTDLHSDAGQAIPDQAWNTTLDAMGSITDTDAEEGADLTRVCLMPCTFVYPDKAVGVGDTWTDTIKGGTDKDDHSMTVNMKAESMDKVGETDVLKVTEDLQEKGTDGLKATSTWWVAKDGKVLKFEVKATNWAVPSLLGEQRMDSTFTGAIAKA